MKKKLLALMILAGGAMFAQTRFSIGTGVGGNGPGYYRPALPADAAAVPPCPGPGYSWVDGYWSQNSGRNTWVAGYWAQPRFSSAYQVAPRYNDNRYNNGFARQGFNRGFNQDRDRSRGYDRNDGHQDHGQSYGNGNGYSNGFRGR